MFDIELLFFCDVFVDGFVGDCLVDFGVFFVVNVNFGLGVGNGEVEMGESVIYVWLGIILVDLLEIEIKCFNGVID